jgi:hypothetical protein
VQTEIQDLVDYKEYNIINCLFQLAMLAKKELQGRQSTKSKNSFPPRTTSTTPSRAATSSGAHSSMTPSASRTPSTSLPPFGAALALQSRVSLLFCRESLQEI